MCDREKYSDCPEIKITTEFGEVVYKFNYSDVTVDDWFMVFKGMLKTLGYQELSISDSICQLYDDLKYENELNSTSNKKIEFEI